MRDVFRRGLDAYRAGRHFEAHEHWEDLWREETDEPRRRFLQGLVQIAAAMHKLVEKHDAEAALRILGRARGHVAAGDGAAFDMEPTAVIAAIDRAAAAIVATRARGQPDAKGVVDLS